MKAAAGFRAVPVAAEGSDAIRVLGSHATVIAFYGSERQGSTADFRFDAEVPKGILFVGVTACLNAPEAEQL